jgi:hypothetical protein
MLRLELAAVQPATVPRTPGLPLFMPGVPPDDPWLYIEIEGIAVPSCDEPEHSLVRHLRAIGLPSGGPFIWSMKTLPGQI